MLLEESWRVFCAIPVPDDVRAKIAAHIARLRQTVPDAHASWTREENIHLTLKFLGHIKRPSVDRLCAAATRAVANSSIFKVSIQDTGAFPDRGPARVLWIGIEDQEGRLRDLWNSLENECANEGFEKETRPLHPHLTLARVRNPRDGRALANAHRQMSFEPIEIDVTELLVIRSELGRNGSRYSVVSRHPFKR